MKFTVHVRAEGEDHETAFFVQQEFLEDAMYLETLLGRQVLRAIASELEYLEKKYDRN